MDIIEEKKGYKRIYHTSMHDFLYRVLNADVIKVFMRKIKYKPYEFTTDGKPVHFSFSRLSKFCDAILFGAHQKKVPLPEVYELEMQIYLDSIK